jgi:hypothetical protein
MLIPTDLPCKASRQINRLTTKISPLATIKTSSFHNLASIARIEEATVASVVPTSTAPIAGCQVRVPPLLSCQAAEAVVVRLRNSRTSRGHQLPAHAVVAPLLKPHVRNLQPCPKPLLNPHQSMLMTIRFVLRRTYVWKMKVRKTRRRRRSRRNPQQRYRQRQSQDSGSH